ncbi:MAG: adenine deaminase [Firmicutes bacterium]|nr:adenine deaminase [Bacillota bacterium]
MIDLAAGRKVSELVLKNCKIINVFSHEIIEGDIAINKGKIVGIGEYEGEEEINMNGKFVSPGLIDSHVHIESSMVTPTQFARTIIPRGTTTIIADPHEIGNVCGLDGIQFMLDSSKEIPLDVYFMLPSCVPATNFENSGAVLEADSLEKMIDNERILGLGELMDYPSTINADEKILSKIEIAKKRDKLIDGHGPGINDKELNSYVTAGVRTEHECSTVEEMIDRLRLGMYIAIREGSAARNLEDLIRGVNKENLRRCIFCTDDRHPEDIINDGHIDNNLKLSIKNGIDPISAIKMATINAAECYNLKNKGAIAPGYDADLVVLDDLREFKVKKVFKKGKLVAENNKALFKVKSYDHSKVVDTVNIKEIENGALKLKLDSDIVNVMRLSAHSLVTEKVVRKVETNDTNEFKVNKNLDILKLAVIERHNATGNIGLGLVENFKLNNGAIASTIAHDSHNLIVVGDNDEDMIKAIEEVTKVGGGITICSEGKVLKTLALPIAGLMSNRSMEDVNKELEEMLDIAYNKLNVNTDLDPFMTLSFLALPVIPELKVTDLGLFDVTKFDFTKLSVEE